MLAGLTVALAALNPPLVTAACAAYLLKQTALDLSKQVGPGYNADDLADHLPITIQQATSPHAIS